MRHAIDTNVLARLLVSDDEEQSLRLKPYFEAELFVPVSVVVECEWVLRSAFGLPRPVLNRLIRSIFDFPNIEFAEASSVLAALDLHEKGFDFADALHLALSKSCSVMLTFDKAFIRRAATSPDLPLVREP